MKLTRRIKTIFVLAALSLQLTAISFIQPVIAGGQTLADPNDVFYVVSPAPNAVVKGNVITLWRAFDNNQASIPYQVDLKAASNCVGHVGNVSTGTKTSSASNDSAISWSSSGPLNNLASVADGQYCMVVCVSLLEGSSPYSACNGRFIFIKNNNSAPQFTSVPASTVSINSSAAWQYQFAASDADGDAISYYLVSAPSFAHIDSNGYLSIDGGAKTVGSYSITVAAADTWGDQSQYAFTLNVVADPSTPSTPTTPTTPTTPGTSTAPSVITISSPNAESEFKLKDNTINWTATDVDGIKSIRLLYSSDRSNWVEIVKLGANANTYKWDVTNVQDGVYFVQVIVEDSTGATTTKVSEQFNIKNIDDDQPITTKPLIINVQPEDLTEATEKRPTITGQFTPPIGQDMVPGSFILKVNNVDITASCTTNTSGFECKPTSDLTLGVNQLVAEITATDDQKATRTWTYSVLDGSTPVNGGSTGNSFNLFGRELNSQSLWLLLLICCVILVLLFVPWLLLSLWHRREVVVEETTYVPSSDTSSTTTVTETAEVNNDNYIDPANYSSYEDYYRAVTNESQPAVSEVTTTTTSEPSYASYPVDEPVPSVTATTTTTEVQPAEPPVPATSITSATTTTKTDSDFTTPDWLQPQQPTIINNYINTPPAPTPVPQEDNSFGSYGYGKKEDE